MSRVPEAVADFLTSRRIAVVGVSRGKDSAANPVFRKLRDAGYDVFPVNPNATHVEGVVCYPDLAHIPGAIEAVIVATHPGVSEQVVRQAMSRGVKRVWFHRSIGAGSVSTAAVEACKSAGISCIVGGCPLMYCEPVDPGHRCMRTVLSWMGRVPR
jgi:predicted CoA-binding protein